MAINTKQKFGGFIYEKPKKEDYPICMAYEDSNDIKIPTKFKLDFQPPQENQLCGNCVAQTLANIMEVMFHNHTNKHEDFSVGFIYGNRSKKDSQGEGMTGYMACDHLTEDGDIKSALFDNPGSAPSIIECVNKFKKEYPNWKKESYIPPLYIREYDIDNVKKFIIKYNVPVMAVVKMTGVGGSGLHAMPIFGWDGDTAYMQNSWGDYCAVVDMKFKKIKEFWMIMPYNIGVFADLPKTHWAYKDLMLALDKKILLGYPDKTLRPDSPITRAEFCAMIYRMLKLNK